MLPRVNRVSASLLDRLLDGPGYDQDRPVPASDTVIALRDAVRRDLEAVLNARRPWRSVPDHLPQLRTSPIAYGICDLSAGAFNDKKRQEAMRADLETTIRRFEPRLTAVEVTLAGEPSLLAGTLVLRIDALLRAEPAPEIVSFDTIVDTGTADIVLRTQEA